jgi:hypothetical protein
LPGNFNRFQARSEASDGSAATDGDRAFVEWWATFDGDTPRREEPTGTLRGWFGKWLESLRRFAGQPAFRVPESRDW